MENKLSLSEQRELKSARQKRLENYERMLERTQDTLKFLTGKDVPLMRIQEFTFEELEEPMLVDAIKKGAYRVVAINLSSNTVVVEYVGKI